MANLTFNLELEDIGVDLQTAMLAWDEFYPIPMKENPEDPGKRIPKFSSRKEHIKSILWGELKKRMNHALEQYAKKDKIVITDDILV